MSYQASFARQLFTVFVMCAVRLSIIFCACYCLHYSVKYLLLFQKLQVSVLFSAFVCHFVPV